MSGIVDMDSILDSEISRSAAREKAAAKEACQNRDRETSARAMQQLLRDTQIYFEARLAAKFGEIATVIRTSDSPKLSLADGLEVTPPTTSSLYGSEEELMQTSMNHLSGLGDIMQPSVHPLGISSPGPSPVSNAAGDSVQLAVKSEQGDNKDWWRDNDDDEEHRPSGDRQFPFPKNRDSIPYFFPVVSSTSGARVRSRNPVNLKKAATSKRNGGLYQGRFPIWPPASQPVTGSKPSRASSQRRPRYRKQTIPEYFVKKDSDSLYSLERRLV
ncbi:hypothetical protein F5Y12DRAFT_780792 [Xylaria sp. FL1777]|nr:hypothetical protein F5Y12DRAFT_780792 [Xylaria sp. FL1777]